MIEKLWAFVTLLLLVFGLNGCGNTQPTDLDKAKYLVQKLVDGYGTNGSMTKAVAEEMKTTLQKAYDNIYALWYIVDRDSVEQTFGTLYQMMRDMNGTSMSRTMTIGYGWDDQAQQFRELTRTIMLHRSENDYGYSISGINGNSSEYNGTISMQHHGAFNPLSGDYFEEGNQTFQVAGVFPCSGDDDVNVFRLDLTVALSTKVDDSGKARMEVHIAGEVQWDQYVFRLQSMRGTVAYHPGAEGALAEVVVDYARMDEVNVTAQLDGYAVVTGLQTSQYATDAWLPGAVTFVGHITSPTGSTAGGSSQWSLTNLEALEQTFPKIPTLKELMAIQVVARTRFDMNLTGTPTPFRMTDRTTFDLDAIESRSTYDYDGILADINTSITVNADNGMQIDSKFIDQNGTTLHLKSDMTSLPEITVESRNGKHLGDFVWDNGGVRVVFDDNTSMTLR